MARITLSRSGSIAAFIACILPVLFGLVIPVATLIVMAVGSEQDLLSPRYLGFIRNSLTLAGIAAVVTVACAILLGSLHRIKGSGLSAASLYVGRLGYAVPGGVIAVGLIVPFAFFDNTLDAWMRATFDISTGLLVTGSGAGVPGLVGRVHLPIVRTGMLTAGLIVFVDVMKELPATLIMRPFNYDTLAVQAHRLASDERLSGAAVPSLVIAAIGLIPVILLCRRMKRDA